MYGIGRAEAGKPIMTIDFSSDCSKPSYRLPHVWERIVGSGHALLALRADWQRDILQCKSDLGFEYVRFHGILCDDLGTLTDQNDQLLYSFHNADQIFDFLVANKMKPFVELSFMPLALSSGDRIVFHYKANVTPPRDYGAWATLIAKLVGHWSDRYGKQEVRSWFFEVWNEPNLPAFWTGSQADYFHLYRVTADAIKAIDSDFRVGGPASADNAWVSEFIEFCNANRVARDFISTHHYPTDAFGKPGDDTLTEFFVREPDRRAARRSGECAQKGRPIARVLHGMEHLLKCARSAPRRILHRRLYRAYKHGTGRAGSGLQLLDLLGHF
jgi:xylan 1,4-beta-xylosidase